MDNIDCNKSWSTSALEENHNSSSTERVTFWRGTVVPGAERAVGAHDVLFTFC